MNNILSLIIESRKKKIELLKSNQKALESLVKKAKPVVSFNKAIKRDGKISLIAEIKQASPSCGVLRKDFSCVQIAKMYEKSKVAAISVLTEEEFFLGKAGYMEDVKKETRLPVLRKDFILDESQVWEARAIGSDAVLLIMRIFY